MSTYNNRQPPHIITPEIVPGITAATYWLIVILLLNAKQFVNAGLPSSLVGKPLSLYLEDIPIF